MTLQEYSIEQLKAAVYDNLVQKETAENNIKIINQEITNRLQQPTQPLEPKVEVNGKEIEEAKTKEKK